jgi:hypothetical protein
MTRVEVSNERSRELAAARREMRRNGAPDLFDAERRTASSNCPPLPKRPPVNARK